MEAEGQPTEEPPADTRPDLNQILEAVVPVPSVLALIPEESDSMETTMPEIAGSGSELRPRQPESEPGSEPVDRNVRPRLAPDQEVTQLDEVEDHQSTTQTRRNVCQTPNEVFVDNPSGDASAKPISYPLVSASNYLTVLPFETEFDSKAQAVVHGSVDTVTEPDSTTFEAIGGMAVFDNETQSCAGKRSSPHSQGEIILQRALRTEKIRLSTSSTDVHPSSQGATLPGVLYRAARAGYVKDSVAPLLTKISIVVYATSGPKCPSSLRFPSQPSILLLQAGGGASPRSPPTPPYSLSSPLENRL